MWKIVKLLRLPSFDLLLLILLIMLFSRIIRLYDMLLLKKLYQLIYIISK